MIDLDKELAKCRTRWQEAKTKGDTTMMGLWEKVGNSIKTRMLERINLPEETDPIKIFDATLLKE